MSGGHFNYEDSTLKHEIFGWGCDYGDVNIPDIFEDIFISRLIYDVFELIHEYDWYVSGDTGRDDYDKKVSEFKRKWFGNVEKTIESIVAEECDNLKNSLLKCVSGF